METHLQKIAIQALNILSFLPFTTHQFNGQTHYINLNLSNRTDRTQVYKISRIEEDVWNITEREANEKGEATIRDLVECFPNPTIERHRNLIMFQKRCEDEGGKVGTSYKQVNYDQVVSFIKQLSDIKMIWMNTHQSLMPNSVSYLYVCAPDQKLPFCQGQDFPPPFKCEIYSYKYTEEEIISQICNYTYQQILSREGIYLLSLLPFRIREEPLLPIKEISLIIEVYTGEKDKTAKYKFSRETPDSWRVSLDDGDLGLFKIEEVYEHILQLGDIKTVTIVPQGQPEEESLLNLQSDLYRDPTELSKDDMIKILEFYRQKSLLRLPLDLNNLPNEALEKYMRQILEFYRDKRIHRYYTEIGAKGEEGLFLRPAMRREIPRRYYGSTWGEVLFEGERPSYAPFSTLKDIPRLYGSLPRGECFPGGIEFQKSKVKFEETQKGQTEKPKQQNYYFY